jgi:hypothetical protein
MSRLSRVVIVAACLAAAARAPAQVGYFRVQSTQQTEIASCEPTNTGQHADLTWTNTVPGSAATLQRTFWLDGFWMTNFVSTDVQTAPDRVTRRVPLPDEPPPYCVCIHNLHLIREAQRRAMDAGYPPEYPSMLTLLQEFGLDGIPVCPRGGIYVLSVLAADPLCTIADDEWPHRLPE